MNWNELFNQFQGQGSIFWIAAFSIAAGATLLLVSGLVLARRGLIRGLLGLVKRRNTAPRGRQSVKLTDTGYTANALTKAVASPANPLVPSPDFRQLNTRLKQAANTLEEIHERLKKEDQARGGYGLKAPQPEVEYVFKTGIG